MRHGDCPKLGCPEAEPEAGIWMCVIYQGARPAEGCEGADGAGKEVDSVCPGVLPRGALECELHHRVGSTGRQVGWGWSFLCPHIPGSIAVGCPWGGRSYPRPCKVTPPSEVGP